jgi:predicted amidohydrolase YtcJ
MTQENLTVAEALRCYTSRGAYAMFMEDEIGKIAPGYRADFIILNESPFAAAPKWERIRPVTVCVEGKVLNLSRN